MAATAKSELSATMAEKADILRDFTARHAAAVGGIRNLSSDTKPVDDKGS